MRQSKAISIKSVGIQDPMARAIRAIFTQNLALKPTERVLVFTDLINPSEPSPSPEDATRRAALVDMARMAHEAARGISPGALYHEFPATGMHGMEPPEAMWKLAFGKEAVAALKVRRLLAKLLSKTLTPQGRQEVFDIIATHKGAAINAVVAMSNFSTSHTQFRKMLTELCAARYISMPLFDASMLAGPMSVDYRALAKRTKAIADALKGAHEVRITTPSGTKLRMDIEGRPVKPDTGLMTKPGAFGNLPAGEAYLAPLEGSSEGKLVVLWGPTRKLDSPITLIINNGKVQDISGSDPYCKVLEGKFSEREDNRSIAELGIGSNERATRPHNILESEKILGTVHVALGDNSSFGGYISTPFHQDFVQFRPSLWYHRAGEPVAMLLEKGKLLLPCHLP